MRYEYKVELENFRVTDHLGGLGINETVALK